ncbi:mRNA export factor [Anaeramoeba flamelloides]|uniref:mRNA export factor n=1 Tax=Anaeramoeba flamelloides TaxID=1746091 RepID=A0ABQ8Z0S9_9EUKA|nr:mRNA export factor [Anaeramoeba flamelloides]
MFKNTEQHNKNDIELKGVPSESITQISWSPTANHLACSSWDGTINVWDPFSSVDMIGKYDFQSPILCNKWNGAGTQIFCGDCSNNVHVWDVVSNQTQLVGKHNAPVKCMFFTKELGSEILITGSWDKTIRYWDFRQQEAAAVVELPERLYTMDYSYPVLLAGCASNELIIYDLNEPTKEYKRFQSPLSRQIRTTSLFKERDGVFIGSIDGRCSVKYFEEKTKSKKTFQFKCHHQKNNVYPINEISVNPEYGTFSTCGGDGRFFFWCKISKSKLGSSCQFENPICCSQYNKDGNIFAYSIGYDWHQGSHIYKNSTKKVRLCLHEMESKELFKDK